MNSDWRAQIHRVYDFVGLEFTAEIETGMAAWLADSEREGLHAGHRYSLDDFGITRGEVDERMLFYRERYAIPYEDT